MASSELWTSTPVGGSDHSIGFRSLMAEFPTGVAIVTAMDQQARPWGMTCSSLCSLSVAPPTLLVCLRKDSPTLHSVTSAGSFAVNLLHGGGREVAELFSSGDPHRFDHIRWTSGPAGPHLMDHAHAIADCSVGGVADGGTHAVVFGEVMQVRSQPGRMPLLYGRRRYRVWPE